PIPLNGMGLPLPHQAVHRHQCQAPGLTGPRYTFLLSISSSSHFTTITIGNPANESIATCLLPALTYNPVDAPPSKLSAVLIERSEEARRSASSSRENAWAALVMRSNRPCLSMATTLRRELAASALNWVRLPLTMSMGDDCVACWRCSLLGS